MAEESTAFVIIGGTGDLALRKLVPALFTLACKGRLPDNLRIVAFARRDYTDDRYREYMWNGVREFVDLAARGDEWKMFVKNMYYVSGDIDDPDSFARLKSRLDGLDRGEDGAANRLYYLSVAPRFFEPAVKNIATAGLANEDNGWRRAVIEKPFGHDLESAQKLNSAVQGVFDEHQVYRIDHYLGKETVQNLLVFRFANAIFEPLWNRRHIASVQITAAESLGMEGGRGGYYDTAGAIRDMVQNYLMQLLCLVAMEPPSRLDADAIRNEKVKVLRTLAPLSPREVAESTVRGQYGPGSLLGRTVAGYREEKGVAEGSVTETFFALRLKLENWRWAGVPFFLRTGKRLPKRATEIAIQFRVPPIGLFERRHLAGAQQTNERIAPNVMVLHLQPDEGISLKFDAKTPGMTMEVQPVKMNFHYGSSFARPSPEAYERLLLDALIGDSTLFTRNDEVDAAWEFITSILEGWNELPPPKFPNYAAGEWGPAEAARLFRPGEGAWRRL